MFTIKFYDGFRQVIEEANSFTILRDKDGCAEITLHRVAGNAVRRDVCPDTPRALSAPPRFERAIIENAHGKTTQIITYQGSPA